MLLGLFLLSVLATPAFAAGRAMTVDDLLAIKGVGDPQVSPDGKWVVYVVSELDRSSGKSNSDLWMVPLAGGEPRRLTTAPGVDNHPRWSPDGKTISFVSNRGGSVQVWLLPIEGGEARQLTKLPIDVAGPIWSPKGDMVAFTAEVVPGKSPEETAKADKEKAESKSKARIYDKLMIRHWNAWDEGKRSHLFVADARTGEAKDLTPKLDVNTPPGPFGGSNEYAFSPDGREIAFTAEPIKDHAWSTNTDIWAVPTAGGVPRNITEDNKGADAQPAYSFDGNYLAYVRQARPGFEADRWTLVLLDLRSHKVGVVQKGLDRPIQSFVWMNKRQAVSAGDPNPFGLLAVLDDAGTESILSLGPVPNEKKEVEIFGDPGRIPMTFVSPPLVKGGVNTAVQDVFPRNDLIFLHADASHPAEVYTARPDGSNPRQLTHHNTPLIDELDLPNAEGFTFKGADGDDVSGWLIKPPNFDEKKKHPVVFLIHGGPQGAWHDEWHGRWNYQMFAAPGYAVVAINPRGSTGYGQKFTDQISKDWTGRVYEDLMKGLDYTLDHYKFLDKDRVAACGGSYGGFMVNWIAGHTDRFKCLISHAGVFDLTSKYGTTEELWFPEWEFGGPPWEHPKIYREQSPSSFAQNFKTPTLVIHGALDFRVPDAQGLGMFTALQRRGVPSRYLFFPDEGHWIAKPENRVVWWREVHKWLGRYL
jgi:dipeptidyl aminopeptidase/acylaminoacyl peptidase